MNRNEKLFAGFIILIVIGFLAASFFKTKKIEIIPTPPVEQVVDKTKVYQDMLTEKCYNEEEIEVSCKG